MQKILTKKRALEIIANFHQAGVLVVGDVMVDHFIWGKVSRISPEAPVPVVDVQKDSILLGGCANVLNNIYAMGGKVYVAGVIGADNVGKRLLTELRRKENRNKRYHCGKRKADYSENKNCRAWSANGAL